MNLYSHFCLQAHITIINCSYNVDYEHTMCSTDVCQSCRHETSQVTLASTSQTCPSLPSYSANKLKDSISCSYNDLDAIANDAHLGNSTMTSFGPSDSELALLEYINTPKDPQGAVGQAGNTIGTDTYSCFTDFNTFYDVTDQIPDHSCQTYENKFAESDCNSSSTVPLVSNKEYDWKDESYASDLYDSIDDISFFTALNDTTVDIDTVNELPVMYGHDVSEYFAVNQTDDGHYETYESIADEFDRYLDYNTSVCANIKHGPMMYDKQGSRDHLQNTCNDDLQKERKTNTLTSKRIYPVIDIASDSDTSKEDLTHDYTTKKTKLANTTNTSKGFAIKQKDRPNKTNSGLDFQKQPSTSDLSRHGNENKSNCASTGFKLDTCYEQQESDLLLFDFDLYHSINKKCIEEFYHPQLHARRLSELLGLDMSCESIKSTYSIIKHLRLNLNSENIIAKLESINSIKIQKVLSFKYAFRSQLFRSVQILLFPNQNSIVFWNEINDIYNNYRDKTKVAATYAKKCEIFVEFIERAILDNQESLKAYKIKPNIWKLQIFMPELYFYLIWRIKKTIESTKTDKCIEHDINSEMAHIFSLLKLYYESSSAKEMLQNCQEENGGVINRYRCFILKSLDKHYKYSVEHYFYKYAFNFRKRIATKTHFGTSANMLYMMAFASNSINLQKACNKVRKTEARRNMPMIYRNFLYNVLCNLETSKREIVVLLQSILGYMKKMNHLERKHKITKIFIPFRNTTLVMSRGTEDNMISAICLTNLQLFDYFHDLIFKEFIE